MNLICNKDPLNWKEENTNENKSIENAPTKLPCILMENETYSNTCTCVVYYERLSAEKPSMVEDKEKSV